MRDILNDDLKRQDMVRVIQSHAKGNPGLFVDDQISEPVISAILNVPRHEFVQKDLIEQAYEDYPISISKGQTISQPYIVALMTELIDLKPGHKVLDIGTGSGYQAAVLSHLVKYVYSVEVIPELEKEASFRLDQLGYHNVLTRCSDGFEGWPDEAPFDSIIVAAASPIIPKPLIHQLSKNGKMIIPIGVKDSLQMLVLIQKLESGDIVSKDIIPVRFVPFTGPQVDSY